VAAGTRVRMAGNESIRKEKKKRDGVEKSYTWASSNPSGDDVGETASLGPLWNRGVWGGAWGRTRLNG